MRRVGLGLALSLCALLFFSTYVGVQFVANKPCAPRFSLKQQRPFLALPEPESLWELGGCDSAQPLFQCQHMFKKDKNGVFEARIANRSDFRKGSLLNYRHNRCAVVGSSGNVLHYDFGKEIDEHDIVMRINPPLSHFQNSSLFGKHVGRRHGDVMIFGNSALENGCPQLNKDQRYVLAMNKGPHSLRTNQFFVDCWKKYNLKTLTLNGVFREKADRLANFIRKQCPSKAKRHAITAGLSTIVFSLHLCYNVDLYGFGLNEANRFEYHRDITTEQKLLAGSTAHDWTTETRLLKYLTSSHDAVSKLMLDGFDPPNIRNCGSSFDLPGGKVCVVK